MSLTKIANRFINFYKKSSNWQILLTLIIIVLLMTYLQNNTSVYEGFGQKEKFVMKENEEADDSFYAKLYDDIMGNETKNNYEIDEIIRLTNVDKNSNIMVSGSRTGEHVDIIKSKGINDVFGIDKSDVFVKKSKEKYPNNDYRKGNIEESMIVSNNTLSHVVCLDMSIYLIKDKRNVFQNIYSWLKPGGYLLLHIVDRDNFDTILDVSNPIIFFSPQKYAKERITTSHVKFKGLDYVADYQPDNKNNKAYFIEKFTDKKTNNVRKHRHTLYIPTQKQVLQFALDVGFEIKDKIDLVDIDHQYQYIYILQRPTA